MSKKTPIAEKLFTAAFLALVALLALIELFPDILPTAQSETANNLIRTTASRALGGVIFLLLIKKMNYHVFGSREKEHLKGIILSVPALIIVINNLPIIGLISGNAKITTPHLIPLFALECLAIGFFEELAFRGFVFPYVLEKLPSSRKGIFLSIVISGGVFGLVHLLNVFAGASIPATLLQIGYSFLIGAMCSVVLLRTKNIWLCVLLHAVYDFCGFLVPTLGEGKIWDTATVIITAVLSVAVCAYMIWLFATADVNDTEKIYQKKIKNFSKRY